MPLDSHFPRVFLVALGVMLALSALLLLAGIRYTIKNENQYMDYLALTKSSEIIEAVYGLLFKAEALSTLVIQGNGEIREFERIAPIIINSPAIRNILLAPAGIVSHIYPPSSNEDLLGYNLLDSGAGNLEAIQARNTKRLTLGGPFDAHQGGQVLVGRLPVMMQLDGNEVFWGLVSVTLSYPEVLASVRLRELEAQGYACEIWRINPDNKEKQIILSTRQARLVNPIEREFPLLNATWMLSVSPTAPWYARLSFGIAVLAALLVSLLIAVVAQNYYDMKRIRLSLEHLAQIDVLTGLPNRRAAFERMSGLLRHCRDRDKSFALVYLDLNAFKEINDTYGHNVGDLVLKEVAQRLTQILRPGQFAARIGGDEFILLIENCDSPECLQPCLDAISAAMKPPLYHACHGDLSFGFSVGYALYPLHGTCEEELTIWADESMYAQKGRQRHPHFRKGHILRPKIEEAYASATATEAAKTEQTKS